MPLRTINDTFFQYYDDQGSIRHAQRGETVDIPEGADLDRGDHWGAFTAEVGQEPEAVADSFVPGIELNWDAQEYARWIDSAKAKEVLEHLDAVAPSDRPMVAQNLIQAEHGRTKGARSTLLQSLAVIAGDAPATIPSVIDPDATDPDADSDEDEDLDKFVASANVDVVVAKAGDDPELAAALLAAEERTASPRVGVTSALSKIAS